MARKKKEEREERSDMDKEIIKQSADTEKSRKKEKGEQYKGIRY